MRKQLRLRQTTLIVVGCGAFLAGLGLSRLEANVPLVAALLVLPFVVISIRKRSVISAISICALGLVLGILRGQSFLPNTVEYDKLEKQKVILNITASTDAVYDAKKQLSFDANNIEVIEPTEIELVGRIRVAGFGENAVFRGDRIRVEGKLFKTRGSRQASIGFAQLQLLSRGDSPIDQIRRKFAAGLGNVLPDPQAPFGLGLLIGQRSTLNKKATDWLSIVGLTHIIAVSGYNLTIIVRFVHRLMSKRSRYQTFLFSVVLIALFLLITGFSASIVRAAIVCALSLVAWYFGHRFSPLLLLLLVASLTAGWYPTYLWSDIGWYLSFLAFFGVLILSPLLVKRFCKREPKALTTALFESFSAQIMTIPLVLYIFHQASLVALISNMLVVPLVPIAMLFTLVAGLAGIFAPEVLGLMAFPARLLLTYMLDLAQLLSRIPHVLLSLQASLVAMIGMYVVIAFVCLILSQRTDDRHGIITDENVI